MKVVQLSYPNPVRRNSWKCASPEETPPAAELRKTVVEVVALTAAWLGKTAKQAVNQLFSGKLRRGFQLIGD